MYSETAGRSRILPNGDLYIEETDSQRILRISTDKVRWVYVNARGDITGALHWSRYIPSDETLGIFR